MKFIYFHGLYAHQYLKTRTAANTTGLQPLFTQGNLYIGLKDAEREQKVNILFQYWMAPVITALPRRYWVELFASE